LSWGAKARLAPRRTATGGTNHFMLLEETWLLPNEIDYLSSVHSDFYACGQSSVDISNNILIGRPYGGTGCYIIKT
jgi:hypothetical protein